MSSVQSSDLGRILNSTGVETPHKDNFWLAPVVEGECIYMCINEIQHLWNERGVENKYEVPGRRKEDCKGSKPDGWV